AVARTLRLRRLAVAHAAGGGARRDAGLVRTLAGCPVLATGVAGAHPVARAVLLTRCALALAGGGTSGCYAAFATFAGGATVCAVSRCARGAPVCAVSRCARGAPGCFICAAT